MVSWDKNENPPKAHTSVFVGALHIFWSRKPLGAIFRHPQPSHSTRLAQLWPAWSVTFIFTTAHWCLLKLDIQEDPIAPLGGAVLVGRVEGRVWFGLGGKALSKSEKGIFDGSFYFLRLGWVVLLRFCMFFLFSFSVVGASCCCFW